MALSLEDKKTIVAEVSKVAAKQAISAVTAEYRGLTVTEMTQLRAQAREAGVYLRVVRNTLLRRALENTAFDCLSDSLVGPLFIAFSLDAPSSAARLLRDFAKDHEKLAVKALAISGKLLAADQIEFVANLPTRNEALSKLMFVMKEPIAKFVKTMAEPHAKLVRTFAALKEKMQ